MKVLYLLSSLKEAGIKIRLVEGQLKIKAPRGKLTSALINEIKDKKDEIIAFLQTNVQKCLEYSPIETAEKKDYYPLSPAQKRLYVLQQMDLESTAYNIPLWVALELELEKKSVQKIFLALLRRHESLRTSFKMIDGEPAQRVHSNVEFEIRCFETTDVTSDQREEKKIEKMIENFVKPFDLTQTPLMRVSLIQVEKRRYLLVVDMHHIISDAVSHYILVQDCMALYAGEKLPPLKLQYKDYSHWQQSQQVQQILKKQEVYWLNEFAGNIPVLNLPTDYPRPPVMSFEGTAVPFSLKEEETNRLNQLARSEGATLFMVVLAILNIFLSKISRQEDMIIGTPVMGRGHSDLQQIIGMFVNTLALRNYPQKEKAFREFLREVKKRSLEAFDNQDYQFENLVDKTVTTRHANRHPLFDVFFALDIAPGKTGDPPTSTSTTTYTYQRETTKFDLKLEGMESGEKLVFTFSYSTKLFKPETIERFISYFTNIVSFVLKHPDETISEIELISQEERARLIKEMRDDKNKQFIGKIKLDKETGSDPDTEAEFDF